MPTGHLEHVNITVSDPERSAALLAQLCGWHIRWRGPSQLGGWTIHVGGTQDYIAVYTRGEGPVPRFGKGAPLKGQAGAVAGAVAGALHVRAMARHYGVPVVLHTDHCAHKLLPWLDGMLEENEKHFALTGEPLFSSHMIDLSEESLAENIATCVKYMQRCAKVNILLEVELGITGGEEDGVDNSQADKSKLYTQPEEVWAMYEALAQVGPMFSIASSLISPVALGTE